MKNSAALAISMKFAQWFHSLEIQMIGFALDCLRAVYFIYSSERSAAQVWRVVPGEIFCQRVNVPANGEDFSLRSK
jgi:hypothetical protein